MREGSNISIGLRFSLALSSTLIVGIAAAPSAFAYSPITFRHGHHLHTLDPDKFPEWQAPVETWRYRGVPITPAPELRVDGDAVPPLPEGMTRTAEPAWSLEAIRATLQSRVAAYLDVPAGSVVISKSATGGVVFDGVGMPGRRVDLDRAAQLTLDAILQGITDVDLPIQETQPSITITDPSLTAMGITEVVTVGESNFAGSPWARRHNIAVGLSKFNGHIIPQGTVFSFNEVLGPVDASTGYKKELVILGERTLPDYGGGLCQVSTTAYRGIWEYGFPIVDRRNHSYSVKYYGPQGTDATIYPPSTDMKFKNDSPGALLMQTVVDGDQAYFIYYGTRDDRDSIVIGPYLWGQTNPPPDRSEETLEIAPGTKRKVGTAVPGTYAAWFRVVSNAPAAPEEIIESYYSIYEARPNFTQIGVVELTPVPESTETGGVIPLSGIESE